MYALNDSQKCVIGWPLRPYAKNIFAFAVLELPKMSLFCESVLSKVFPKVSPLIE
jgi:hypothetical protein